jgi:hypothetical protein
MVGSAILLATKKFIFGATPVMTAPLDTLELIITLVSLTRALITGTFHILTVHSIRVGIPSARCGSLAIAKSLSVFITAIIARTVRTPRCPFVHFVGYTKIAKFFMFQHLAVHRYNSVA